MRSTRRNCSLRFQDIPQSVLRRENTHQFPNRPDFRATHRRCRPGVSSGDFEGMIQIFGIVENTLASIAGDDLVVLANLLVYLRPNSNLTDLADFVTRGGDADSAPVFSNS